MKVERILRVVVGEHHAFFRDAVDTGRLVAHQAMRIGADVRLPDIIAKNDKDVRPRRLLLSLSLCGLRLRRPLLCLSQVRGEQGTEGNSDHANNRHARENVPADPTCRTRA
jgi:hypothetical protein